MGDTKAAVEASVTTSLLKQDVIDSGLPISTHLMACTSAVSAFHTDIFGKMLEQTLDILMKQQFFHILQSFYTSDNRYFDAINKCIVTKYA